MSNFQDRIDEVEREKGEIAKRLMVDFAHNILEKLLGFKGGETPSLKIQDPKIGFGEVCLTDIL